MATIAAARPNNDIAVVLVRTLEVPLAVGASVLVSMMSPTVGREVGISVPVGTGAGLSKGVGATGDGVGATGTGIEGASVILYPGT